MIAALLLAQFALAPAPSPVPPRGAGPGADSFPSYTLAEALERSTRLNPDYVRAMGRLGEAEWARTAARLAFIVPAVSLTMDATRYSTAFFNIGTGRVQQSSVTGSANAVYELFSARKITDLARTSAELDAAAATEVQQRYNAALVTERAFYLVLEQEELLRVAETRVARAREQLEVARARVVSGAAVQSDSLKLRLELSRAEVQRLVEAYGLRTVRLELGRRVGESGPVGAVPLDTLAPPDLPFDQAEATARALRQGPEYLVARARERAAAATYRGSRGRYLPTVTLTGSQLRFDDHIFPTARTVSLITFGVSLPVWDLGQRELAIRQAKTEHNVAGAIRADLERAAARDIGVAYDGYETSRASLAIAAEGLAVARETYRVQDARYRGGATTILDLLDAQIDLSLAESGLVQARYINLLALAALEVMLGERLFPERLGGGA